MPNQPTKTAITGGYRIECPSDEPDFDREYCALIRVDTPVGGGTPVEVQLLWGDYLDPLDGSTIDQVYLPTSSTYYWITRVIKYNTVTDSTPLYFAKKGKIKETSEPCPFTAIIPVPPIPKLVKKDRQKPQVIVSVKDWEPNWSDNTPPAQPGEPPRKAGTMIEARIMRKEVEHKGGTLHYRRWEKGRDHEKERNRNWHIVAWKEGEPDYIFGDRPFEDNDVDKQRTYGYVVEVMYDYGDDLEDKFRYRVATSEALIVEMKAVADTQDPPARPHKPNPESK